MSLAEILDAVRVLPHAEKVQLMHRLVDEISPRVATAEDLPEYFRPFLVPGAVAHMGYQVTTDEAGWRAIEQMPADIKGQA